MRWPQNHSQRVYSIENLLQNWSFNWEAPLPCGYNGWMAFSNAGERHVISQSQVLEFYNKMLGSNVVKHNLRRRQEDRKYHQCHLAEFLNNLRHWFWSKNSTQLLYSSYPKTHIHSHQMSCHAPCNQQALKQGIELISEANSPFPADLTTGTHLPEESWQKSRYLVLKIIDAKYKIMTSLD